MIPKVEQFLTTRFLTVRNAVEARDEGQGLVEYALIIALIAVGAVTTMGLLGTGISDKFASITGSL
jgi:pilus assembly protein Flp/PilA